MMAWAVGLVVILLGAGLVVGSFVPDDALVAIPLPGGAWRRRLRPLGLVLLMIGLLVPLVRYQPGPASPIPTTATAIATQTAPPTIPLVPTITPRPPSPTPQPTRWTPAPDQFL
jgi:hypothetical protein